MTGDSSDTTSTADFVDSLDTGDRVALCGLFRRGGGASRVIQQQATELSEYGYDVTVVALEADMNTPDGVDLLLMNPVQDHTYLSRLYWLVFPLLPVFPYVVTKLLSFDIVIAHRYPFTVSGRAASLLSNTVYVYWSHPSGDSATGFERAARLWVGFINRLETRGPGVATADHIVAVSDASAAYLSRFVSIPITTIPNTVNPDRFPSAPPTDRIHDRYSIDASVPVVLYVGRITQKKNLLRLLDVFAAATKDGPDATLVLTGTAPQADYLLRLREQAGANVLFTGYVSDDELAALYEISGVFATCSLEEGWGLPISEATYFGLDVVAFDSHPAAVAEDATYLVPEGDYDAFRDALRKSLEKTVQDT